MADFLSNKKVWKGFAVLSSKRGEVSMGVVCSKDIDPSLMLDFACIKIPAVDTNRESLDQELKLEDALRMSKLNASQPRGC